MTTANMPATDRVPITDERLRGLRRFNAIMGVLHLVQGVFMIAVSNATTYPIFTNFLVLPVVEVGQPGDAQRRAQAGEAGPNPHHVEVVGARDLRRGMNPVRFYEYALSSSVMIVLIGMLTGIWDLGAIILIFALNGTMNLFGIMMEYHNYYTKKVDWTAFIYGSVAGVVPWIVIFWYFYGAVNSGDQGPPGFVYVIIPTLFVFFNIFAVNMVLQYKKVGPWRDYVYGERVYIILSLAAKSLLCWMIWSGYWGSGRFR